MPKGTEKVRRHREGAERIISCIKIEKDWGKKTYRQEKTEKMDDFGKFNLEQSD